MIIEILGITAAMLLVGVAILAGLLVYFFRSGEPSDWGENMKGKK
jgi:hypothetical protein